MSGFHCLYSAAKAAVSLLMLCFRRRLPSREDIFLFHLKHNFVRKFFNLCVTLTRLMLVLSTLGCAHDYLRSSVSYGEGNAGRHTGFIIPRKFGPSWVKRLSVSTECTILSASRDLHQVSGTTYVVQVNSLWDPPKDSHPRRPGSPLPEVKKESRGGYYVLYRLVDRSLSVCRNARAGTT